MALTAVRETWLATAGFSAKVVKALLNPGHVAGLRTFLTVHYFELNLVAFLQALVSVIVDRAVMHEHIRVAILTANKAEAFGVIEPLHGSFQSHVVFLRAKPHSIPPRDAGLELRQSGRAQKPRFEKRHAPWQIYGRQEYGLLNSFNPSVLPVCGVVKRV